MAKKTSTSHDRDVEAFATDENSPLLTTDVDGHETVQAKAARFKCLYTPSLSSDSSATAAEEDPHKISQAKQNVASMICLLLIGTFVSSADGYILTATYPLISSTFHSLSHASLLSTSYLLTVCSSQPILAKLSDIYGRKLILLTSYFLFTLGTVYCGLANSFSSILVARAVAGIGGGGLEVVNSILIQDLVPRREVAMWRGIANVAKTMGRTVGGPLGGWLSDVVGWRWGFVGQGPVMGVAFCLVAWRLEVPSDEVVVLGDPDLVVKKKKGESEVVGKLKRVDFGGAGLITISIVLVIVAMDLPNQGFSWSSSVVLSCVTASLILIVSFLLFEAHCPAEPIYPPRLLKQSSVWTSYIGLSCILACQLSMMFTVPLYFQITTNASAGEVGTRLVPSSIAATFGSLFAGWYIKHTGRYKRLTIVAAILAASAPTLMILTWKGQPQLSWWKGLVIVPGGLGAGIALGTTFIIATSGLQPKDYAVGAGGLYLMNNIGCVLGTGLVSSIQTAALRGFLARALPGDEGRIVIEGVVKDIHFMDTLSGEMKRVVIDAYVRSLDRAHLFSLAAGLMCFVVSFFIPKERL